MQLLQLLFDNLLLSSAVLVVAYVLFTAVSRLYLSPLRKFPGPKIAALTFWYQFYHNFFRDGTYVFRVRDMHAKYGPIIRITPTELHVNDPAFLPVLMPAGGKRRDKYEREVRLFGFTLAAGSTLEHDLHRKRRAAMTKMFSKESVRRLEPIMQRNLDILYARLDQAQTIAADVELLPMFGAFTNDLISEYAYGESHGWLRGDHFNKPFFRMLDGFHDGTPLAIHFRWFFPLTNSIPKWLFMKLKPDFASIVDFREKLLDNIDSVRRSHQQNKDGKTVFDEIFDSKLPDVEKSPERLLAEAQNISIAGTATTGWTLTVMVTYLVSHPEVLGKLKAELESAIPDAMDMPVLKTVENLPYLSAVVSEVLRLAIGVSSRQTRIAPDEVMQYNDGNKAWAIPPGTPVGMATPLIHFNPAVFPEPYTFDPERFIRNPGQKQAVMSFSYGSRQCLGIQLAYAEIYLVTASLWRRYGAGDIQGAVGKIALHESGLKDVEMVRDAFIPYPYRESKGVRVKIVR